MRRVRAKDYSMLAEAEERTTAGTFLERSNRDRANEDRLISGSNRTNLE
jgi:hypothetical protein